MTNQTAIQTAIANANEDGAAYHVVMFNLDDCIIVSESEAGYVAPEGEFIFTAYPEA